MEYEDRPYQSEGLDALDASGEHRNLLVLPIGAGKTYIFSRYRSRIPGQTLMISHRREIIYMTRIFSIGISLKMNGTYELNYNKGRKLKKNAAKL